jgi:hypothetical protein
MILSQEFTQLLEHSLKAAVQQGTRTEQRQVLAPLLQSTSRYADAVARGDATWELVRGWAAENAQLAIDACQVLASCSAAIASIFYGGGEEDAERALIQQSQFELVRDLFRDTAAEPFLEPIRSAEVEDDYRQAAEQLQLVAPSWVPRSHSWWYWPQAE